MTKFQVLLKMSKLMHARQVWKIFEKPAHRLKLEARSNSTSETKESENARSDYHLEG